MQTDCPTDDMRDRKMKRNNNDRMRRRMVSRKIRLRKKLPHTRDPEFATPESQGKKRYAQGQKKRGHNTKRSKLNTSSALMNRRTAAWDAEQKKPLAAVHMLRPAQEGAVLLTISCCSCICVIFLVYFWSTCFSSPTTPSQRSLRAFLSLMSCTDTTQFWELRENRALKQLRPEPLSSYLIDEGELSLNCALILFFLQLELPAQLPLFLLLML